MKPMLVDLFSFRVESFACVLAGSDDVGSGGSVTRQTQVAWQHFDCVGVPVKEFR